MDKGPESKREFTKTVEIGVLSVLLPHLLRDLTLLPRATANGIGIFIGLVTAYWLPPRERFSFIKWLLASITIAACVFLLSTYL